MRNKVQVLLIVIVFMFLSTPKYSQAQQNSVELSCPKQETPQITISKTAKIEASPDEATISLSIWIEEVRLERASSQVKAISSKITALAKQAGVADADITTTRYEVSPMFQGKKLFSRVDKPSTYVVAHDLTIKLKNLDALGQLVGDISIIDNVSLRGIDFSSSQMDELKRQATVKAATNVKATAEAVVAAAGGKLGKILKIEESANQIYAGRQEMGMMKMMDSVAAAPMPVEAGTLSIEASCTITFEIAQ